MLDLRPRGIEDGVSAPRAAWWLQGGMATAARPHGGVVNVVNVSGAALGRAAALNEGRVRVLLRLQSGRRENVGGQAAQLIGARGRRPVVVHLGEKTDRSESGG